MMRILHTADWHLGKMFYGEYLTDDQEYVLRQQFLPLLKEAAVDVVVIAGDIYDRSLPPTGAVELFDEMITKIANEAHIPCMIISGNHDSATRLSFGNNLLSAQGIYIAGDWNKLANPVIMEDKFGKVSFYLIPFADPAEIRQQFGNRDVHDHESALRQVLAYYPRGTARSVCVAHAFVTGGITSDSERPLAIGGTEVVDVSCFDGFSYTALGHLHGPQQAGGRKNVRYAGSLLKYSFGEARQKKSFLLVDMDGNGQVAFESIPIMSRRDVRIIEGDFATLMAAEDTQTDDFILARVLDSEPILDGMTKIRQKYPNALALETPNRRMMGMQEGPRAVGKTTEFELFQSFVQSMRGEGLSVQEQACATDIWQRLLAEDGDGML